MSLHHNRNAEMQPTVNYRKSIMCNFQTFPWSSILSRTDRLQNLIRILRSYPCVNIIQVSCRQQMSNFVIDKSFQFRKGQFKCNKKVPLSTKEIRLDNIKLFPYFFKGISHQVIFSLALPCLFWFTHRMRIEALICHYVLYREWELVWVVT